MAANKIIPCLWIEKDAKKAARYYISVFKKGKIISYQSFKQSSSGSFDTAMVEVPGLRFQILAAGPLFKFSEAISFVITCKDQIEIDYYWKVLTSKGGEEQACGWLKDRYGLSWQVVPAQLSKLLVHKDKAKREYAMQKMLTMKKIIISDLIKAPK
jgi:predicted 3-demethylubiquinone-9 3-methyltransferase (glyoxalase superfamily)